MRWWRRPWTRSSRPRGPARSGTARSSSSTWRRWCAFAPARRERTRSRPVATFPVSCAPLRDGKDNYMLLAAFYVFAIAAIILHYTGHLKRWNCEWVLIVLAIAVFPAVLFL